MEQVCWTEYARNEFLHESGLIYRSELGSLKARELITVLKKHIADETNSQIAEEMHMSESRIDEYLRELRDMYDDIVYYTFKLVPRENLTKKDIETQIQRYGYVLNIENLREYRGYGK